MIFYKATFYFLIHIGLAYAMRSSPQLTTIHCYALFVIGLFICFTSATKHPERVCYLLAYVAGSEILWRMNRAVTLWEFGKYSVCVFVLLSLAKRKNRWTGLPMLFLVMLMPAILLLPIDTLPFDEIRKRVSSNLAGPVALGLCCMFFAKVVISRKQLYTMIYTFLGPVLGIGALAATTSWINRDDFVTTRNSSFAGSGGFGPNQVSAILGLGALLAFFVVLDSKKNKKLTFLFLPIILGLLIQTLLTFSRGGMYCALGGGLMMFLGMAIKKGNRMRTLVLVTMLGLVSQFVIWPLVVNITGGQIEKRFKKTSLSSRESIMKEDLEIWRDNILFGVGPGQAAYHRKHFEVLVSPHSEFTRLLAEHGLLGVVAMGLMFAIAYKFYSKARDDRSKGWAAAMLMWAMMHMMVYATRVVAASWTFGMAGLILLDGPMPLRKKPPPALEKPEEKAVPPA